MRIIHIIDSDTWEKNQEQPQYFGDTLKSQGFIHCCFPVQVEAVLKKWFPGRDDMIFLEIESNELSSPVKFENLEGGEEKFPHIYGPINKEAIISWYSSEKK